MLPLVLKRNGYVLTSQKVSKKNCQPGVTQAGAIDHGLLAMVFFTGQRKCSYQNSLDRIRPAKITGRSINLQKCQKSRFFKLFDFLNFPHLDYTDKLK